MTRKQVAARLGRSLATVRRLKGTELHPVVDATGVHRFDPSEVEALARDNVQPRVFRAFAVSEVTSAEPNGDCVSCSRSHDQMKRLEAELDNIGREHARQLDDLRARHEQALAQSAIEQRELESALSELLEALEE